MMKIATCSYQSAFFAQEQEDLKNELRADIEVKINECKKLTKVGKSCKRYFITEEKRKMNIKGAGSAREPPFGLDGV